MAKRRKCAETEADTKKPKQVLNAEGRGAKTRSRKKAPGIKSQGCKSDVLFLPAVAVALLCKGCCWHPENCHRYVNLYLRSLFQQQSEYYKLIYL